MDATASVSAKRQIMYYAIGSALLVLGLYLRLDSLAASLWLDEFGTFWVVERDFVTALRRCWDFQGQSPLYYALPWMSIHTFGESEIALRTPSLMLGVVFVAVLYVSAGRLGGSAAGFYAAAFGWLAYPAVAASVDARPYALVLLTTSVAIGGFQAAVRSGNTRARVVWVAGGALTAWAHYVQYPVVVGLGVGYALLPNLRSRYRVRQFIFDAAVQGVLVALSLPQVVSLWARRGALTWLDEWDHFAFMAPLMALMPAILICLPERRAVSEEDRLARAFRRCLLCSLLSQLVALEVAAMFGTNLLAGRYFTATLVPAILLVAASLARLGKVERAAAVITFALITAAIFVNTKRVSGTFSGIGNQNWRSSVAELSRRIEGNPQSPVFFRSGFVEEDLQPLGSPPLATLAPLRSPSQAPFAVPVTSLTFRWRHPARERYFEESIAPIVDPAKRFYLLSSRFSLEQTPYPNQFARWVQEKWPGRFEINRTNFGGVDLVEFRRHD